MPRVPVRDIEMSYESRGEGAPLLVIGGLGLTVAEMRPLADGLAVGLRVVTVDNRGTGQSAAPPGPYNIEQMADDAAALMDRLEIGRASVLGVSVGGRIALALALAHPRRVERLVLVSTGARVVGRRRPVRLGMLMARLPMARGSDPQPGHAMRAQFDASTRFDCVARLPQIGQPTLVVHGRTDRVAPVELAEQLHTGIRGSRLVLLDGGHLIALSPRQRDTLCGSVRAFLLSG